MVSTKTKPKTKSEAVEIAQEDERAGVALPGVEGSVAPRPLLVGGLVVAAAVLLVGIGYLLFTLAGRSLTIPSGAPGPDGAPKYQFSIYGDKDFSLRSPLTAVEAPSGDIYVADTGNKVVQVFDYNGKPKAVIGRLGREGSPPEQMAYPIGLAVDEEGNLFVSDSGAKHIYVFDRKGQFSGYFGEDEQGKRFGTPAGILYRKGLLYVNDLSSHKVLVLDRTGALKQEIGSGKGEDLGQLQFPNYSWVDEAGNVYVADSNNNRVQIYAPNGEVLRNFAGEQGNLKMVVPRGIAVDSRGYIHVVSVFGHRVQVYDGEGVGVMSYGQLGQGEGEMNFPNGLYISGRRIYVADRENNRVQVWGY